MTMSEEVQVVHMESENSTNSRRLQWEEWGQETHSDAGRVLPKLVVLPCPFRKVIKPILNYKIKLEEEAPKHRIAVIISELVELIRRARLTSPNLDRRACIRQVLTRPDTGKP